MPREDWFLLRGDMVQRMVTARRETHIPEGKEPDQELQAENKQIPLPLSSLPVLPSSPSLPLFPFLPLPFLPAAPALPYQREEETALERFLEQKADQHPQHCLGE